MKSILVTSDMHLGSTAAIMPESYELPDGNVVYANPNQITLLERWERMCDEWKKPDLIVLNGDIVDGPQPATAGTETWTSDVMDQVNAAEILLRQLKGKKHLFITGTPYHSSNRGLEYEEILAKRFGQEIVRPEESVKINGVDKFFHFSHSIGVSTSIYRTTAIARELAVALLNSKSLYNYEWTIRSHAHYFVHVEFKSHQGLITPCWQIKTPYMVGKSAFGMIPDIGAIRIVVESNGDSELEKMIWHNPKPPLNEIKL